MKIGREIKILDCLGKAIRFYVSLPDQASKKELKKAVGLFEFVVTHDNRNELIVPLKRYCQKE